MTPFHRIGGYVICQCLIILLPATPALADDPPPGPTTQPTCPEARTITPAELVSIGTGTFIPSALVRHSKADFAKLMTSQEAFAKRIEFQGITLVVLSTKAARSGKDYVIVIRQTDNPGVVARCVHPIGRAEHRECKSPNGICYGKSRDWKVTPGNAADYFSRLCPGKRGVNVPPLGEFILGKSSYHFVHEVQKGKKRLHEIITCSPSKSTARVVPCAEPVEVEATAGDTPKVVCPASPPAPEPGEI